MERKQYLDVAKGLLIIFVVMWHTLCVISSHDISYDSADSIIGFKIVPTLFLPFFMQAFFIISGYCSNFQISLKLLIKKNVLTLWFPALLVAIVAFIVKNPIFHTDACFVITKIFRGSLQWFLLALIWSKIIVWFALHIRSTGIRLTAIVLIYTLSIRWGMYAQNTHVYLFLQQGLAAVPYVYLGYWLRRMDAFENKRFLNITSALWLAVSAFYVLSGTPSPWIGYNFVFTHYYEIPIIVILAVSGSMFVINISKYINCQALAYVGRASLIVYIVHYHLLRSLVDNISVQEILKCNKLSFVIGYCFIVGAATIVSTLIYRVVSTKYLKWTLGKFQG